MLVVLVVALVHYEVSEKTDLEMDEGRFPKTNFDARDETADFLDRTACPRVLGWMRLSQAFCCLVL